MMNLLLKGKLCYSSLKISLNMSWFKTWKFNLYLLDHEIQLIDHKAISTLKRNNNSNSFKEAWLDLSAPSGPHQWPLKLPLIVQFQRHLGKNKNQKKLGSWLTFAALSFELLTNYKF